MGPKLAQTDRQTDMWRGNRILFRKKSYNNPNGKLRVPHNAVYSNCHFCAVYTNYKIDSVIGLGMITAP
uniref:Galactose-1-phosphate uridylyltransferase n=1 Tax=Haemonchus contortus TaxID=6289 RepID=A0A7I4XVN0_HAECO